MQDMNRAPEWAQDQGRFANQIESGVPAGTRKSSMTCTGGFASLHHRLISAAPPGQYITSQSSPAESGSARTQVSLLAFNGSDVRPAWDPGVDQVASRRKPREVSEIDTPVGVARDGRRQADEICRAHHQPLAVDAYPVLPPAVGV